MSSFFYLLISFLGCKNGTKNENFGPFLTFFEGTVFVPYPRYEKVPGGTFKALFIVFDFFPFPVKKLVEVLEWFNLLKNLSKGLKTTVVTPFHNAGKKNPFLCKSCRVGWEICTDMSPHKDTFLRG